MTQQTELAVVEQPDSEEWRIVAAYPTYAVSNLGHVKRIIPDTRNHKITGIPLKAATSPRGYLMISLCADGYTSTKRINRLVCEAFHGSPPTSKHHAAHNDGDVSNNRKDNLRWATGVENEADKRIHGTAAIGDRHWSKLSPEKRAKGEGHGLSKLTVKDIPKIRTDTRSQRQIAADFGVTQRVIWSVKSRKTWGHVE
jgi:HNH endonuclease